MGNDSPPLLAEEVAESALQRSVQRPPSHHVRSSEQGTTRKAQRILLLLDPPSPDPSSIVPSSAHFSFSPRQAMAS